jgi:hypothetical protein
MGKNQRQGNEKFCIRRKPGAQSPFLPIAISHLPFHTNPMRWRARTLIGLGIILLVAISVVIFFPSNEPTYEGRTLSEWMEDYTIDYSVRYKSNELYVSWAPSKRAPQVALASNAIYHIGPQGVPYLLKWMDYRPPSWKGRIGSFVCSIPYGKSVIQRIRYPLEKPMILAVGSVNSFAILQPYAEEIVPVLTQQMNKPKTGLNLAAAFCLSKMGPPGLPPLMNALSDTTRTNRARMVYYISLMGTNAKPAIPLLVKVLRNEKLTVSEAASNYVMMIDPSLSNVFQP